MSQATIDKIAETLHDDVRAKIDLCNLRAPKAEALTELYLGRMQRKALLKIARDSWDSGGHEIEGRRFCGLVVHFVDDADYLETGFRS